MTNHRPSPQRRPAPRRPGEDIPPVREYVEYHWHRIFAALAVAALLAVAAVYGVTALLKDSPPEVESLVVGEPVQALPDAADGVRAADVPAEVAVVRDTPAVETAPEATPVAAETSEAPHTSALPAAMPAAPDEPDEPEIPASASNEAVAPAAGAEVEILAPGLARAQLTLALADKEPVGVLPQPLAMNEQGLLRVFLFTETRALKGQLHFHDWYLNGNRVARVPIRPYSDQMRASSGKYIDRTMTGDWRVEVVTAAGERLASGAFVVQP